MQKNINSLNIEFMLDMYIALNEYVKSDVDGGSFKFKYDEYAKKFQKLSYSDQGELGYLINEYYK